MTLFAISDLHILGSDDPLYQSLVVLIRDRATSGDKLVLVGDIFDLFVGDKPVFIRRYQNFLEAVADASVRGVEVHYIEGNHDFFLKQVFSKMPRVRVHSHEVSLELDGQRFFFVHGDTVDRKDYGYRVLRFFLRSWMIRLFVSLAPGILIDRIGKMSSYQSKKRKRMVSSDMPLLRMEYLRKIFRSYAAEKLALGFDFVVMGHCHDLDEMFFMIDGRKAQYVNIGFPRLHGSFLSWSLGDEKIHREKLP